MKAIVIKSIVAIAAALALTLGAVAAPAATPADGRMQSVYDLENHVFYEKPFVEQTGEGWEPPVQNPDGNWSQRFVYDGVAYSTGHYSGLAEPPYPYPYVMLPNSTATWIPQWGSWYLKYTKEEAYLDSIIGAQGGGAHVRNMDGKVADWCKPLPTAQAQKKQEAAK